MFKSEDIASKEPSDNIGKRRLFLYPRLMKKVKTDSLSYFSNLIDLSD